MACRLLEDEVVEPMSRLIAVYDVAQRLSIGMVVGLNAMQHAVPWMPGMADVGCASRDYERGEKYRVYERPDGEGTTDAF